MGHRNQAPNGAWPHGVRVELERITSAMPSSPSRYAGGCWYTAPAGVGLRSI
jgi:hypothetical protein